MKSNIVRVGAATVLAGAIAPGVPQAASAADTVADKDCNVGKGYVEVLSDQAPKRPDGVGMICFTGAGTLDNLSIGGVSGVNAGGYKAEFYTDTNRPGVPNPIKLDKDGEWGTNKGDAPIHITKIVISSSTKSASDKAAASLSIFSAVGKFFSSITSWL